MIIVMTTVADLKTARDLAGKILDLKLAGCVQILPQMNSVYVWDGEIREDAEYLLLIKTLDAKWEQIRDLIADEHSYDVPEIVSVSAANVSKAYEKWLGAAVSGGS